MLDFFGTIGGAIMAPLYYVISAVLVGFHKLFGGIFGPETGVAWVLSIIGWICILTFILIPVGIVLIAAYWIMLLVCHIMAAVKASRGEVYRYPMQLPILH